MQILKLIAERDRELTSQDLATILNQHPQRMDHDLSNLTRRRYISHTISFVVPSGPPTYYLIEKGRELLMSKNVT